MLNLDCECVCVWMDLVAFVIDSWGARTWGFVGVGWCAGGGGHCGGYLDILIVTDKPWGPRALGLIRVLAHGLIKTQAAWGGVGGVGGGCLRLISPTRRRRRYCATPL